MVRTFLNLASLDRSFSSYVERGRDLTPALELGGMAHAASVDLEFRRKEAALVTGQIVQWPESHPFGDRSPSSTLEDTGRLRASWQPGHADSIHVITPKRIERGSRVPYAAPLRGGTGQFLDTSPLILTSDKAANTRVPYSKDDPRYYAQWWAILLEHGVAITPEVFFHLELKRRPHGVWHPKLRRYLTSQILNLIIGGRRAMRPWQLSEIAA